MKPTIFASHRVEAVQEKSNINHDTLKELIRLASRELDEAISWLAKTDVDSNPNLLKIVDCITRPPAVSPSLTMR